MTRSTQIDLGRFAARLLVRVLLGLTILVGVLGALDYAKPHGWRTSDRAVQIRAL